MTRIIVCSGMGEPYYSGVKCIVRALRSLGHEVLTCGPSYSYMGNTDVADIPLPDKAFPETWTYDEVLTTYDNVLSNCPVSPDLILQVEPHFSLRGRKPPGIKSAYYILDPHRGGREWFNWAVYGSFDTVFVSQYYYLPLFQSLLSRVEYLPFGFEEEGFDYDLNEEPEVEITFAGETGIAGMEYPFCDNIGMYATHAPKNLPTDRTRYAFHFHNGDDYAERAELLMRLCNDFNVRLYQKFDTRRSYQRSIQRGVVGFNRSLLKDTTYRALEIAACGRTLVTDKIPNQKDLIPYCIEYETFFKPFLSNFDLEYAYVKGIIQDTLEKRGHERFRQTLEVNKKYVWDNHTWKKRCERLLELALN